MEANKKTIDINNLITLSNKIDYLTLQLDKLDGTLSKHINSTSERNLYVERELSNLKGQFRSSLFFIGMLITIINIVIQFLMKG